MTKAERFIGTSDTYVGKVEYRYCLSCDSALSERIEYSPSSSTTITSWRRYEYDGLNVLRVDEKYDTAGGTLDTNDPWRTIEVNTHKPGSLGALVGKRFYVHTNNDATPDQTNDYTYTYDALGNVQVVYKASGSTGQEAYFFTQDAFGNELSGDANIPASNRTNLLGSATWASARTAGITEHQTGKIQSAFSGLQHFGARWYDPVVGRFVSVESRIQLRNDHTTTLRGSCQCSISSMAAFVDPPVPDEQGFVRFVQDGCYTLCGNNPLSWFDPDGEAPKDPDPKPPTIGDLLVGFWNLWNSIWSDNLWRLGPGCLDCSVKWTAAWTWEPIYGKNGKIIGKRPAGSCSKLFNGLANMGLCYECHEVLEDLMRKCVNNKIFQTEAWRQLKHIWFTYCDGLRI